MLTKCVTVLFLIAFSFSSCEKDKGDALVPPSPVAGKWVGVFTLNGAPTGNLAFVIKEGGLLEAQNTAGQKIGDGTWQLTNASFTATYTATTPTPTKYNFIGTLENPTKLSGAFGLGSSQVNGGFWNATKQP